MALGIVNRFRLLANQPVTASIVLQTITGFSYAVVAGQRIAYSARLILSVGAAGGVRLQLTGPAAPTLYNVSLLLANTVAPAVVSGMITAPAVLTNALANAGTHFVTLFGSVVPSVAGTLELQFAQNSSDATPCTMIAGSYFEVVTLN